MTGPGRAPGVFVTGTDTGVGKTFLAASLVAALRAAGVEVRVRKPLLSGLAEQVGDGPPHDHVLLAMVAGSDAPETIAPLRFDPSVSPHLAAREAGVEVDVDGLVADLKATVAASELTVVEGAGGLMVPIAGEFTYKDLAVELGLPVVIAARPGLGTINHSLLTVEAARTVGLSVRAVVFGPWPESPSAMELDNIATVAELGAVETATLPRIDHRAPESFALAGAGLPLESILAA